MDLTESSYGHDESCGSEKDFGGDDDDDDFLDGTIPSMAQFYNNQEQEEPEEEEEDKPCIHYLGRNYEASELVHSAPVLEQSFRNTRKSRRATYTVGSSMSTNIAAITSMSSSSSMKLDSSEHLSDRWSQQPATVVEEEEEEQEEETQGLTSKTSHHSRRRQRQRRERRCSLPATQSLPTKSSSGPARMSNSSFTSRLRASISNKLPTSMSQSEVFSSTRRRATEVDSMNASMTHFTAPRQRRASTMRVVLFGPSEQELLEEAQLNRWGYSNLDVKNIIDDKETFAKLKSDLKARQAVTNNLIGQRIHVFVKNQKHRQQQLLWEQQQEQEQQQAQTVQS
eukprot:Sro62_g035440.1 n/a (339) ;mRNA; r:91673-92689